MVVILTAGAQADRTGVGRALAAETGWRFEDAGSVADVRAAAASATDRREPLVVACPAVDARQRDILRSNVRQLRFVQLRHGTVEEQPFPDLAVDASQPLEVVVAAIRKEFGI